MQPGQLGTELDAPDDPLDELPGDRFAEGAPPAIPPWLEHVPDPVLELTHPSLHRVPPTLAAAAAVAVGASRAGNAPLGAADGSVAEALLGGAAVARAVATPGSAR